MYVQYTDMIVLYVNNKDRANTVHLICWFPLSYLVKQTTRCSTQRQKHTTCPSHLKSCSAFLRAVYNHIAKTSAASDGLFICIRTPCSCVKPFGMSAYLVSYADMRCNCKKCHSDTRKI